MLSIRNVRVLGHFREKNIDWHRDSKCIDKWHYDDIIVPECFVQSQRKGQI